MSKFEFKTEWLDQIVLLAENGSTDDVVSFCVMLAEYVETGNSGEGTGLANLALYPIIAEMAKQKDLHEKRVRAGKSRWSNFAQVCSSNAQTMVEQCSSNAQAEKEIKEKEKKQKKENTEKEYTDASEDTCSNIVSVSSSLSCSELEKPTSEPPLITLPLNNGTEWPVTTEMVSEWSALYPAVDVMQELRKMRGWCCAKPKNRKTPRGIQAFITNWLSKEQDRGRSRASPVRPPAQRRLTPIEVYNLPAINPWSEDGS